MYVEILHVCIIQWVGLHLCKHTIPNTCTINCDNMDLPYYYCACVCNDKYMYSFSIFITTDMSKTCLYFVHQYHVCIERRVSLLVTCISDDNCLKSNFPCIVASNC